MSFRWFHSSSFIRFHQKESEGAATGLLGRATPEGAAAAGAGLLEERVSVRVRVRV
jgi:hypothetical protein